MTSDERILSVHVDETTLRSLRALGEPADVLERLVRIASAGSNADSTRDAALSEAEPPRSQRLPADEALLAEQREANEQLVRSALRAHDVADQAEAARRQADDRRRELQEGAELREMFIGILGHDLRNPLTSVVTGATALLHRGHLDEADTTAATRILRGGQRIERMVTQLLDLTRARLGGGFVLQRGAGDMCEWCSEVVDEFEASVELVVHGDLTGSWDRDRIAEVVSNLAGNAIEHAARGTTVTVSAYPAGEDVVVEVRNRGEPIPPDVLPFIFEPFRSARKREKPAAGNLGLGLYIAHQIVIAHGGTLRAASAEGSTTFTMRLPRGAPGAPLREAQEQTAAARVAPEGVPPTRPARGAPRRILVVDDEPEATDWLVYLLEREGHEVVGASDGLSALDAVGLFDPEVVILDLGLPAMDGYELARRVRQERGGADRLLVAVTGYSSEQLREDRSDFDAWLTKPPDLVELIALIARWR